MLLRRRFVSLATLLFTPALFAQDERSVTSPDGRITFRVFVAEQDPGNLSRLAYDVSVRGKRIIERSYLGLDIENQEPLLGENEGLIGTKTGSGPGYRSLIAEFMQNGSIGRRINVEARVFNDGVAFRYILPKQTPLEELLLGDEVTEFRFSQKVPTSDRVPLPLFVQQPGIGWVAIAEVKSGKYPAASLAHLDPKSFVTRLATHPSNPDVVYEGTTPLTCPWRVVVFGPDRDRLLQSEIFRELAH